MSKQQTRTSKRLVIVYDDGRVERINPNRPKLLIAFEMEHGVQQPQTHAQIAWLAWHALGRPADSIDAWLDTVEEIDADEVEMGKAAS